MPKATSLSGSALRRNQACRQCRKKKLKCDAARPHCSTCVKAWKGRIAVPAPLGYVHDPEPDCSYDPTDGLSLLPVLSDEPVERIRTLEAQIAELKGQLSKAQDENSRSVSPHSGYRGGSSHYHEPSASPNFSSPASGSSIRLPQTLPPPRSIYFPNNGSHRAAGFPLKSEQYEPMNINQHSSGRQFPNDVTNSPPSYHLIARGWNPDLPEPDAIQRYAEVFFACDACGSRVIHKPSFMASLTLPTDHENYPHPALLHAICATASRWVSQEVSYTADGQRRDKFADFHARKARSYIDQTMTSGSSIFAVLQACILLSWYFYMEGRWVEVWIFSGFQTRVSVPLRLNHPGTHYSDSLSNGSYLPPPTSARELESRRRAWWMAVMFDRIVSIGGWLHGVDEQDIGTELPLRSIDFELESDTPSNPQHLWSESVLTTHPPQYTDSLILLIKATILFGRVTEFNVRTGLRSSGGIERAGNITSSSSFIALDRLVHRDFIQSLPPAFRNCLGAGLLADGARIDTDLYLVHLLPHAATITLHNPHVNPTDPTNVSADRCLRAADAILEAYHLITSTSFDITRLHPTVVICWYLAAVVRVQYCKRLIELGQRESEAKVWGEINLMRLAMLEYGSHSPIGSRQEKLLQGMLTEILHLTSTHNPLLVRMPLYPFSHSRVFQNATLDTQSSDGTTDITHVAPLPSPAPFPDEEMPVAGSLDRERY